MRAQQPMRAKMLYLMVLIVLLCKLSESTILECSSTCPGNEFHCECQASDVLRWRVMLPDGTSCRRYYPDNEDTLGTCQAASVILSNQDNINFTSSLNINLTNQAIVSCEGFDGTKRLTLNATSK